MWNFFEQPWTLLGAAVIVLLGVLTFRIVWPEKRAWWQWLLPVGIAVLAVGLDWAVATDYEKIDRIGKIAMRAAEQEDCAALGRLLAFAPGVSAYPGVFNDLVRMHTLLRIR